MAHAGDLQKRHARKYVTARGNGKAAPCAPVYAQAGKAASFWRQAAAAVGSYG
jgi:hypothetical protein